MKKLLLPFVLMLLPIVACADAVVIDGIYYNLVSKVKQAEVTENPNQYKNDVAIPPTVTYGGIEYNVTSIGNYAFDGCSRLISVTIPNSVTSIGDFAFYCCSGLTAVTIPNSVTSIGISAFRNCSGLTSVTIPNSVTTIEEDTFLGCSGLTSVTIPNSVTSIGYGAFRDCSSLTSITIPNSVTSIDSYAFANCKSLTSVIIPNSVTSISEAVFWGCSALTSVTIPNSVTSIGNYAFASCKSLTSVTIPNSVTSIRDYAFEGCSAMTTLKIGNGGSRLIIIFERAFANCPEITDVYCYAENVPSTHTTAFDGSYPDYATLHVPQESITAYSAKEPWSNFGTIKTIEGGDVIETPKCATPTISYESKRLMFDCDTEGVEYVSEIKVTDGKKYYDNSISLEATYEITVYATKVEYSNSDVATATLVWTNATFTETTPSHGITTSAKAIEENIPVLISSHSGSITINSEADGQKVEAYAVNGQFLGSATVQNGQATISTKLEKGSVAIVKLGEKAVKIVMQ